MKKLLYILTLLLVISSCKKAEQDELTVKVTIPNAFRPGSDPSSTPCLDGDPQCNEEFRVVVHPNGMSYSFSLSIFNTQQELVLKTDDSRKGWNGTFENSNKRICPQGSYNYLVKVTELPSGKSKLFEGKVLLLR